MTANGKAAQIVEALMERAAGLVIGSPALPIAYPEPGADFDTPAEAPDGKYLDVRFFPNSPAWQGLSDGRLDQGILQVSVVWPKNDGVVRPAEAAQLVIDHFPKGLVLRSGATRVKLDGEPWIAGQLSETNRLILPVTIPWTA